MLVLSERTPKFVRQFGQIGEQIAQPSAPMRAAVKDRSFPAVENTYPLKKG